MYIVKLYAWGPGSLPDTDSLLRYDTVYVYPTPVADFIVTPDSVMLPNQSIQCYNRSTNAEFFDWNFGDNSKPDTTENAEHYYTKAGNYNIILKVYTKHLCFDSKSYPYPIVVQDAGLCSFPNAFTPSVSGSSDGRWFHPDPSNHIFHPLHRGIRTYKLEIFNRWGEKIFESNDPAIGWDGYRDGKLNPQDVYVWKVQGTYKNGTPFKNAGDVTLIR